MAKVKALADIAAKFATVTPQRAEEYTKGVEQSEVDWANATAAAESAYQDGVTKAIGRKAFGKGVKAAGTEKYKKGVREKGGARFSAGVALAGPAYQDGFAPFHQVIQSTQLPPRFARRDPRNLERVRAMATALGKAKEARTGA
jgi:hypothetical protein